MTITKTLTKSALAAAIAVGTIGATTANASAFGATPLGYSNPVPFRTPVACDQYSRDYANWAVGNRGGQALVGSVIGAGVGALIGGFFFGAPIAGAAIGGGAGALGGAVWNTPQWQGEYHNAYQACMSGYQLPALPH